MNRALAGTALSSLLAVALLCSTATGAETTHEQYVGAVNPICKKGGRAIARIPNKIKPSGDPIADTIRASARFATILGNSIRRIAAVAPPPAEKDVVGAWIKGLRQQKSLIDRSVRVARKGNIAGAAALGKRVAKIERQNGAKADKLGLTACSA